MADEPHVEGSFRRSLFILLVTIGVISAASLLLVRDARSELGRSERQRDTLSKQLTTVLNNQKNFATTATEREKAAARRQQALEDAIAQFLAGSSDPAVAGPLARLGYSPTPSADHRPSPTPTRSSRPMPKPSPKPSPSPKPLVQICPPVPQVPCLPSDLRRLLLPPSISGPTP
jgi:hypothetical protein